MIRVRRYEIIKLGLDGGEGDGVARGREGGDGIEEGVRGRWEPALDVGGDGTLQGAATRKRAGG